MHLKIFNLLPYFKVLEASFNPFDDLERGSITQLLLKINNLLLITKLFGEQKDRRK